MELPDCLQGQVLLVAVRKAYQRCCYMQPMDVLRKEGRVKHSHTMSVDSTDSLFTSTQTQLGWAIHHKPIVGAAPSGALVKEPPYCTAEWTLLQRKSSRTGY